MKEYKKKIEFKEIQSLEYNLLKRFDEFAKENNITYRDFLHITPPNKYIR